MRIESMDAATRPTLSMMTIHEKSDLPVKQAAPVNEQESLPGKVSEAFIKKAVGRANETMRIQGRSLEFRIHEKTNEIIVKIVDTDTKEVIREIPSEKMLDMFANMLELAGLIVDERR